MSTHKTKLFILGPLFVFWVVADLGTKHWADISLADSRHPLIFPVSDNEAGQAASEVVANALGVSVSELGDTLPHISLLPPVKAISPNDRVYDPAGPLAEATAVYAFWRGRDLPPRRLNKSEVDTTLNWAIAARSNADRPKLKAKVDEAYADLTVGQWLKQKLRRLDDERIQALTADGIHPISGPVERVSGSTPVEAGQTLMVQWRRVDVMGDWFKFAYAENPGAAFGFMGKVPETIRDTVFFSLTVIVFFAILIAIIRTEERYWAVNIAFVSILGGAIGNFVDRLRYGYVIDFIDMDFGFYHYPTYNVADIAITVGVIVIIADILFNKESPLATEPSATERDQA